ncbi:uncharacterized protein EDB93DRAFT_1105727 [Suillus bovinus]|uniref:uncharacterized protein n=1 Tax=Suillus bovinus TaxID=48563 RepID=UPI001B86A725|nr:uncharacterized protein EDB93DRAFT_1105727 [Suillus bovinus]KAG2141449.1 hypothetical protein EDB93DRAFT_1105727 [Suillus bovinus]
MNHTGDLVGSEQVIMAYSDGQVTAGDISHALFYANSHLLAMRLYVYKSFSTSLPGYAEAFHKLMKWEMETFVTPFINISFLSRCSAVIPTPLHHVIAIMIAHTLVDRQPDVTEFLTDIKALNLSVHCKESDEYDIACMPDYFNAWWKDNLTSCKVSDMLPKSSVQDVMELVEGHFVELPDHVETGLLPYMLKLGPVHTPETIGSVSLAECRQMAIGKDLMEILQGRMMKLTHSSDRLACLAGPVEEIMRAVVSSQMLMDRLNADDSASKGQSSIM